LKKHGRRRECRTKRSRRKLRFLALRLVEFSRAGGTSSPLEPLQLWATHSLRNNRGIFVELSQGQEVFFARRARLSTLASGQPLGRKLVWLDLRLKRRDQPAFRLWNRDRNMCFFAPITEVCNTSECPVSDPPSE